MSTSNSAVTMVSEEIQSPLRYASDLIDEEWEILQPIIFVDTIGFLIIVRLCAANIFDGKAARQFITDMFSFLHTVTKIWADNGYSVPELSDWLWLQFGCLIEVVRKQIGLSGFHVLPSSMGG